MESFDRATIELALSNTHQIFTDLVQDFSVLVTDISVNEIECCPCMRFTI